MIGKTLAHYEITRAIGKGGMGEVYQATDTRLDRTVAIKVLPEHLADDPKRRERFEREARAISSLNHPHICTLHDIGEADGVHYLVMEYVEGQTLARRLEKGPLKLDQALEYAIQIADALDKAHRQGVVHRDLKPGNIMLTKSGVKLLDFGLAKLETTRAPLEQQSTVEEKEPLTAEGEILGTLQYMAPEQLEGRDTDARTDVFAFGAVLYEMVAGKKAFQGERSANLIAAILQSKPMPLSLLRSGVPGLLDRVVDGCLAKDPEDRWSALHDVVLQLEGVRKEDWSARSPGSTAEVGKKRARFVVVATGVVGILLAALLSPMLYEQETQNDAPFRHLEIFPPEDLTFFSPAAVSPDGKHIAVVAGNTSANTRIWVRDIDAPELRPLSGTDGAYARMPFWSPDSRFIAFSDGINLQKVALSGGSPQVVCAMASFFSGTWGANGDIIFAAETLSRSGLYRVSAAGGEAVPTTVPSDEQLRHIFPQFLPDGRRFLYVAVGATPALYVASLDSDETTRLKDRFSPAVYATSGHLLFFERTANTLMAEPFDTNSLSTTGEAVSIATGVTAFVSVSRNGVVVGTPEFQEHQSQLVWFDRKGGKIRDASGVQPSGYQTPWFSPDEQSVVLERHAQTGNNLWLLDLARATSSRFTFDRASHDGSPVWAPDGESIVYSSVRESGAWSLNLKPSSGSDEVEKLLDAPEEMHTTDWSRDNRFVIYEKVSGAGNWDVFMLPLTGEREPAALLETPFNERHAQLSPDTRWIVYVSDESGQPEVYVQSFPLGGGKWKISAEGGGQPRWRRDGKETLYVTPNSNLTSVQVDASAETLEVSLPQTLFALSLPTYPVGIFGMRNQYLASADGERFLVDTLADEERAFGSISVLLNWTSLFEESQ